MSNWLPTFDSLLTARRALVWTCCCQLWVLCTGGKSNRGRRSKSHDPDWNSAVAAWDCSELLWLDASSCDSWTLLKENVLHLWEFFYGHLTSFILEYNKEAMNFLVRWMVLEMHSFSQDSDDQGQFIRFCCSLNKVHNLKMSLLAQGKCDGQFLTFCSRIKNWSCERRFDPYWPPVISSCEGNTKYNHGGPLSQTRLQNELMMHHLL